MGKGLKLEDIEMHITGKLKYKKYSEKARYQNVLERKHVIIIRVMHFTILFIIFSVCMDSPNFP